MAEAFDAVETVRSVLRTLEEQYVVVSLVRDILDRGLERGDRIRARARAARRLLASSWLRSRSTASPRVRSASLGPTRMNYEQALASVAIVSRRLGQRLSEG